MKYNNMKYLIAILLLCIMTTPLSAKKKYSMIQRATSWESQVITSFKECRQVLFIRYYS